MGYKMEYEFNLKFKLAPEYSDENDIMNRLGESKCTDALVGLGLPGYISLEFIREGNSAEETILSALADVRGALPSAILVEAGPDFVGLTDVADLVGMSRQNMRKLFNKHPAFPPPVHGGSTMVWHLAQILQFLREREREQKCDLAPTVIEVAKTAMQVNINKEKELLDSKFGEKFRQRIIA